MGIRRMRIRIITQGEWGERIAAHLAETAPHVWSLSTWRGPAVLPVVLDEPELYLPEALPQADRQAERRLEAMGVGHAFPMPFCSLAPSARQHPLVRAFAERYGRPEVTCTAEDGHVAACQVVRETPCGNTRYIAQRLPGTPVGQAAERAGLLHHYYPCWGGMAIDPVHGSHTLLHIAAKMAQQAVERSLKTQGIRAKDG